MSWYAWPACALKVKTSWSLVPWSAALARPPTLSGEADALVSPTSSTLVSVNVHDQLAAPAVLGENWRYTVPLVTGRKAALSVDVDASLSSTTPPLVVTTARQPRVELQLSA